MALAQIVYQISKDTDFARQMQSDPDKALAERGLRLNLDELPILLDILKKGEQKIIALAEKALPWVW